MARMRAVADNAHNERFSSSHPELLRNIDIFLTARTANPKAIHSFDIASFDIHLCDIHQLAIKMGRCIFSAIQPI